MTRATLLTLLVLIAFQDRKPVSTAGDIDAPDAIGVSLNDVNPERGLSVLDSKGLADKAGIKGGDTIKKVEGVDVKSWDDFVGVCQEKCLAAELKLDIDRDGKAQKVTLKLSAQKSPVSGGRGGKSGSRSIKAGDKDRTYEVKAPPAATKGAPLPLLVLLHGDGGTGKGMIDWTPAAGQEAILLALDGIGQGWRDAGDISFVMAAIEAAKAEFNIDLRRVYAIGFSSGAFLAYRLGIEKGHVFAAVGIYEGSGSPVEKPSHRKTAFVFLAGAIDPTVRAADIKKSADDLKTKGHVSEYLEIKNLDHDYKTEHSKAVWERVRAYLIK
jgi:predicted esterase